MVIASVGAVPAFFIVDGEGPTRSLESDEEEEEGEEEEEEVVLDEELDGEDCLSLHSGTTYGAISTGQSGTGSRASSAKVLV